MAVKGQKKSGGKGTSNNWFLEQEKKQTANSTKSSSKADKQPSNQHDFISVEDAPILKIQMGSKKEEVHFEKALAFALKVSDPSSNELQTIHLNMEDELVFNMPKDQVYETLWQSHRLLLLIEFPKNWKTMPLEAFDDDGDPIEFEDDVDRFDYLYEMGMALYEGDIK